jgi:ATP-dependent DNA helicase RecQ
MENYAQEVGRAGRDGRPATCEVFFCPDDLNTLENFAYGDTPSQEAVAGMIGHLLAAGDDFDVSIYDLSSTYDIRLTVVRTLLTYLELLGYTESGTPFYATYQFKPLVASAEMLRRFDGERRDFLTQLLAQSRKAKIWFEVDLDRAAAAIGATRDRVVRALDYLAEQGLMELRTAGIRQRYHVKRRPENPQTLTHSLYERLMQRETREIHRLRQVAEWVEHDACQVVDLGVHFGDERRQPCGHCSWCLRGAKPCRLPPRPESAFAADLWPKVQLLRREYPNQLRDPRSLARFLCGVSSPWLVRAKLQNHPLFGACGHVPFPTILQRANDG